MRKYIKSIKTLAFLYLIFQSVALQAQTVISGKVTDYIVNEPLPGVYVLISGTTTGVVTDNNGYYSLSLQEGVYSLEFRYISYQTATSGPLIVTGNEDNMHVDISLMPAETAIDEVYVVARKNMETERSLLTERRQSALAIENMGVREMGRKGISNVAEGVKKMTGISLAETGQVYVRGLGDRYSATTLNGLPIASPNPDNKLIPLDLFPSDVVQHITVNKVYSAGSYADYSGAHIDINLKEHTGQDFFTINIGAGSNSRSFFSDFYESDKTNGLFLVRNLLPAIKKMTSNGFSSYVRNNDPFGTSFSVSRKTLIPKLNGGLGFGKTWGSASHKLAMLVSLNAGYNGTVEKDSYVSMLNAQGTVLNEFNYDSYTAKLDMAALVHLAYTAGAHHHLSYTLFYTRNAVDNYKYRTGHDSEGIQLTGSNSVFHEYELLNNQLIYSWMVNEKWSLNAAVSLGTTGSYEPDRRQVMYRRDDDRLSIFKLNKQETMRYFGELSEREVAANIYAQYKINDSYSLQFGTFYKNKSRDYASVRFYYNLNNLNPEIENIYETDSWLNNKNLSDGTITITKDAQPKSSYFAGTDIGGLYLQADLLPFRNFQLNLGLRYEPSSQWVRYWTDGSLERRSELIVHDLFPAVNMKLSIRESGFLRLALSRTVTRPLFIEMAPFLYKESYGSTEIRGNESLKNGYNINADLRYEYFGSNDDLFSGALYFKRLQDPIERVQESSGGSAVHSFRNSEKGIAAGIEVEARKIIIPGLRIGLNASYMYTNVILPEGGGVYTDTSRPLQGASPYLVNADLTCGWKVKKEGQITLTALYNLQGPRIHAVGIYGMGNVMQQPVHTLDFVGIYNRSDKWSVKIEVGNILDTRILFTQKVAGENVNVENHKTGVSFQMGFSYTFK